MASIYQTNSERLLESAFDILGPVCKQRLAVHLRLECGIEIKEVTSDNLGEIRSAIIKIFGDAAAAILMRHIYSELS